MAYGIWPWFTEKKWMDYSSILLAEPSRQPILGVITARLLISPTVQQCFSLVLIAATSWTNLQLEPEETCTICWLWTEYCMRNLYRKHKYFSFETHIKECVSNLHFHFTTPIYKYLPHITCRKVLEFRATLRWWPHVLTSLLRAFIRFTNWLWLHW